MIENGLALIDEEIAAREVNAYAAHMLTIDAIKPIAIEPAEEDDADLFNDDVVSDSDTIDPLKEYYSLLNGKFGRVILDEAHKIRNPTSHS